MESIRLTIPRAMLASAVLFLWLSVLPGCGDRGCDVADVGKGLVAYWDFNECSGTAVLDVSGNAYHGTIYGGEWVPNAPLCGCALDIVGETDGVWDIPATWDDDIGNYVTVAAWVTWHGPAPEDPGRACYVFDGRGAGGMERYGMYLTIWPSGQIFFQLLRGLEADNITLYSNLMMPVGRATYLAVVLNQPDGWLRLYVNGQLDTSIAAAGGYVPSGLSAAIGNNRWARGDLQWRQLHGIVDELRIYNRALEEGEILELSDRCGAPSMSTTP